MVRCVIVKHLKPRTRILGYSSGHWYMQSHFVEDFGYDEEVDEDYRISPASGRAIRTVKLTKYTDIAALFKGFEKVRPDVRSGVLRDKKGNYCFVTPPLILEHISRNRNTKFGPAESTLRLTFSTGFATATGSIQFGLWKQHAKVKKHLKQNPISDLFIIQTKVNIIHAIEEFGLADFPAARALTDQSKLLHEAIQSADPDDEKSFLHDVEDLEDDLPLSVCPPPPPPPTFEVGSLHLFRGDGNVVTLGEILEEENERMEVKVHWYGDEKQEGVRGPWKKAYIVTEMSGGKKKRKVQKRMLYCSKKGYRNHHKYSDWVYWESAVLCNVKLDRKHFISDACMAKLSAEAEEFAAMTV